LSDYQKYGFAQEALDASTMLMLLLTEQPNKLQELKQLIDNYDRNSINFNENHDLPPIHRQFYYYKGKYFESVNQLDSAEHYYRKVYHPDMRFVDNDPMYRGLLSVFRKCHIADSIAKYAQLYCMVNDSSIAVKDQHLTAQLAASYDYNYYQYQAFENERKAYRNGLAFVISLFGSLIIVGIGIYLGRIYKKKQEQKRQRMVEEHRMAEFLLKEEFLKAKNEYTEKIEDLQQLEETYRLACHDAQQTLSSLRTENESFRNENAEKQQALEKVSMMYEQEKTKLIEDINTLTKKIDELKSNEAITAYLGKSQQLADTSIVTLLKELEKDPRKIMTKSQYNEFEKTVCNYYPNLVYDLRQTSKLTMKDRQVCLLTALNFRPGTIANLASLSSSQVTNAKAKINMQLFNDPSAMTLYANLTNRYDICPS
jgi:DNA repair exonuclease SbcCD ATPase subunit